MVTTAAARQPPDTAQADSVVKELLALLTGGQAHTSLEAAVKDFPEDLRGHVPERLPYLAWQLIEHLRIAQRDILDFCAPPPSGYQHKEWPKEYWPATAEPPTPESWDGGPAVRFGDAGSKPQ